jgi:MFS family permease
MTTQKIFHRDFVLAFFAQFSISFVICLLVPTLPIYLSRQGSTEVEIGILIGVLGFASLVLRPPVGRGLLRIPERKFMIGGGILFAFSSIAYLWATPFWPFLAVRILQGIAVALFYTASVTLAANISPEARRGQSLSYFFLAFNVAFALAPTVGMFLMNVFNMTILFVFCTVMSFLSLFISTRLQRREIDPPERPSIQDDPYFSHEALPPAIINFLSHIIWGAMTAFFPLYALHCGFPNPGLFFAVSAAMLIAGRSLGAKIQDRYSREKIILPCLIIFATSMAVLAFSKTFPMFMFVAILWGIGGAFLFPALVLLTLDLGGSSRGPALATFTAFQDFGVGLGPVIMGVVLRLTSYRTMFLSLAFVGLISILYFHFFIRRKDGLRGK